MWLGSARDGREAAAERVTGPAHSVLVGVTAGGADQVGQITAVQLDLIVDPVAVIGRHALDSLVATLGGVVVVEEGDLVDHASQLAARLAVDLAGVEPSVDEHLIGEVLGGDVHTVLQGGQRNLTLIRSNCARCAAM